MTARLGGRYRLSLANNVPTNPVFFIDTSVLCNLLKVPGRSDDYQAVQDEFERRRKRGAKFILPITTLIETGNFIAQSGGDRHAAAGRFEAAVQAAASADPPWIIRDVQWSTHFLEHLLAGNSTGSTLVEHFAAKGLAAGDLAILIERDEFINSTSFSDVRIWTLDEKLDVYNPG